MGGSWAAQLCRSIMLQGSGGFVVAALPWPSHYENVWVWMKKKKAVYFSCLLQKGPNKVLFFKKSSFLKTEVGVKRIPLSRSPPGSDQEVELATRTMTSHAKQGKPCGRFHRDSEIRNKLFLFFFLKNLLRNHMWLWCVNVAISKQNKLMSFEVKT